MDLMSQLMKMPFGMVVSSFETLADTARWMNRGLDTMTSDARTCATALQGPMVGRPPAMPAPPAYVNVAPPAPAPVPAPSYPRHERRCDDLSDDMVMLVKWTIVYSKPDEEKFLATDYDMLNYAANIGQYAGQKMAL